MSASLATVGGGLAVFLWFGSAMWSQLTIGWEWSTTGAMAPVATLATQALSVAIPALLAIAVTIQAAHTSRRSLRLARSPA